MALPRNRLPLISACQIDQGFNAEFVVQQTPRNASETGMSVAVANAAINSGTVGSAFANNGGQLTISNLIAEDVDAASLISTSNEGTSFLEDSIVRNSAVDSITTTTSAASQSVNGVQVQKMRRLSETFTVSGSLSGLAISSTIVSDNNATIGASWSGVTVRSGASATVDSFEMSRNAGLEFGVSVSSTDSRLVVKESLFVENQGTVRCCRARFELRVVHARHLTQCDTSIRLPAVSAARQSHFRRAR
jgi:hypothetical protein